MPKLIKHQSIWVEIYQNPNCLLIGSEIHLWFLPFAFLGSIGAFWLCRAIVRLGGTARLVACTVIALASSAIPSMLGRTLETPWSAWLYGLPLIPIGLAIGMAQKLPWRRLICHYAVILTVAFVMTLILGAPSYFLGVLALALSILPRSREWKALRWFAGLSMGIYLMHPGFFLVVYKFFPQAPWYDFAGFALVGSIAAGAIISLIPRLDRLMFGAVRRVPKSSAAPLASSCPGPDGSMAGAVVGRHPLEAKPSASRLEWTDPRQAALAT